MMKKETFRECIDASRLAIQKTTTLLSQLTNTDTLLPRILLHSGLKRSNTQSQYWELIAEGFLFRLPTDLAASFEKYCEESGSEIVRWFESLTLPDRARCERLLV